MKTIGIMCDHYKVDKFKELLTKNGFTNFEVKPQKDMTIIKVIVRKQNINKVHKICQQVEAFYNKTKLN